MPPSGDRRGGDRRAHALDAGVEHGDAAALVLDEVDVHRPRHAAAHAPDAVGDRLGGGARQLARRPRLRVERAQHGRLGARARLREHADLAGEAEPVRERDVRGDQPVADGEQVHPAELDAAAGRPDALVVGVAGERAGRAPQHRDPVAARDDVLDRHREVGHRGEEPAEEPPHAVGALDGRLADELVHAVGRPAVARGLQVVARERVEVGGDDGARIGGHGRNGTVRGDAEADSAHGGGARRARGPGRVAAAAAAALAGRAALQRLGARRRRRDRARRLRAARARVDGAPGARAGAGRPAARARAAARLHPRAHRPLRPGGGDPGADGLRAVDPSPPRAPHRRRPRDGAGPADRGGAARAACRRRRCGAGPSSARRTTAACPARSIRRATSSPASRS